MATTKKSSKATSKPSKKPAAKKTTSAAKTTKATASKKAASTKKSATKVTSARKTATPKVVKADVSKKKDKKPADRKTVLRRLNVVSVLLGLLGAVAAGMLMNNTSYQFMTGLLTTNPLTGGLAPAVHVVWDVELRWLVVSTLVLSALVPLLAATRSRKKYEAAVDAAVMPWRWVDTALVGGLMVGTIALLSGVQDIMTLVLIGGFVALSSALGLMSEKQNAGASRSYRGAFTLGMFAAAMPWVFILVYALGTPIWGMTNNSWAVYGLYITTLLCGFGTMAAQRAYIDRKSSYDMKEQRYVVYGILAKVAFVLLLVLGFKK